MVYTIEIARPARRKLESAPIEMRRCISVHIDALAENPRPDGVKKLHDVPDGYRIRVGDWRIVYQIKDERLFILVLRIGHRSDVYRRL